MGWNPFAVQVLCRNDFDKKILLLLDALWERNKLQEAPGSGRDGRLRSGMLRCWKFYGSSHSWRVGPSRKACNHVKKVVEVLPRDKVTHWRGWEG